MANVLEIFFSGILLGSVYALSASGLSLVFGIMGVVNLAHAEFIMLGAYATYGIWILTKVSPLIAILGSVLIIFLFSLVVYKTTIKRIIGEEQLVSLIITYGISIILWNFAQLTFTSSFKSIDYSLGSFAWSGVYFSINQVIGLGIVVLIMVGLHQFLIRSKIGKAIRAVAQNPTVAALSGINLDRTRMIGFGIAGILASIAGGLISIQWSIYPLMGVDLILKCFAIVAIGGLGSLPGSLVGGLILGLVESLGTYYLDSMLANIFAPLMLILTFLFRPQGLFGVVERVD